MSNIKYTFLDLAEDVLEEASKPLHANEIWERADDEKKQKLNSSGKTPAATLGARLYVDVSKNNSTRFIKTDGRPACFFLKKHEDKFNYTQPSVEDDKKDEPSPKHNAWKEKDLHPLLAYFVFNPSLFGVEVHAKTISHEKSHKDGYSSWLYPDMVGVHVPLAPYKEEIVKLNDELANKDLLRLYSFELKKNLDKDNYREVFFQAVSNSSWAHEGYLVAANINEEEEELTSELKRLSSHFGIGIISLDLVDIGSSKILFAATPNQSLGWDTMNKIVKNKNADFIDFINNLTSSAKINRIVGKYDEIIEEPSEYVKSKRMNTAE